MACLSDILTFANEYLNVDQFDDYCPNGLQVQGNSEVQKIVSGVSASQALLDGAIEREADLILVHHGYFWKGESQVITGIKYQKIKTLIDSNVSLLAYHLPLDAHPECGNNVTLAGLLGVSAKTFVGPGKHPLVLLGEVVEPIYVDDLLERIRGRLGREPLHIGARRNKKIRHVAICTGGAQNYFSEAINQGVDVFITGEVSEQHYHMALESGVDFISAGHHATERYGVKAFANILSEHFSVQTEYLEIPNPV